MFLVDEPMAAGIGAGLPITEPTGSMIVDIGGGTTEVAIISLADISTCESIRIGGDNFDEALINHLKKTYNLLIGESRAEQVKIQIGSAAPLEQEMTMEIAGRDTISGLPRKIVITSEEIREAFREPIAGIIEAVMRTLERAADDARLLDPGHKVKITRGDVYRTLCLTYVVAPSNHLVRGYYRRLAARARRGR